MDHNPWSSGNISEFLFYNCPECDVKEKDLIILEEAETENTWLYWLNMFGE